MARRQVSLVVFDMDNTLWDFNTTFQKSFDALVTDLEGLTGLPRQELLDGFKTLSMRYRIVEDRELMAEHPALKRIFPSGEPDQDVRNALSVFRAIQHRRCQAYDGIKTTIEELKSEGCKVVVYSECQASLAAERLKKLGLDGLVDALYTPKMRYDLPTDPSEGVRMQEARFGLDFTKHKIILSPSPKDTGEALLQILADYEADNDEAVMIGDSRARDVAMAQSVGVNGILAAYGHQPSGDIIKATGSLTDAQLARMHEMEKVEPWATAQTPREIMSFIGGPLAIDAELSPTRKSELADRFNNAAAPRETHEGLVTWSHVCQAYAEGLRAQNLPQHQPKMVPLLRPFLDRLRDKVAKREIYAQIPDRVNFSHYRRDLRNSEGGPPRYVMLRASDILATLSEVGLGPDAPPVQLPGGRGAFNAYDAFEAAARSLGPTGFRPAPRVQLDEPAPPPKTRAHHLAKPRP